MGITDWKHWLVVIVVAVLLFGTKRLKTLGPDLGETIKGFRRAMSAEAADGPPSLPDSSPAIGQTQAQAGTPGTEVPAPSQRG